MEPEVSLPHTQAPATCPYSEQNYQRTSPGPKHMYPFRNKNNF